MFALVLRTTYRQNRFFTKSINRQNINKNLIKGSVIVTGASFLGLAFLKYGDEENKIDNTTPIYDRHDYHVKEIFDKLDIPLKDNYTDAVCKSIAENNMEDFKYLVEHAEIDDYPINPIKNNNDLWENYYLGNLRNVLDGDKIIKAIVSLGNTEMMKYFITKYESEHNTHWDYDILRHWAKDDHNMIECFNFLENKRSHKSNE